MSRRLPLDPDGRRQRTDPSFQPGSTRGRIGNASPVGDGGGRGRVRPTSPGNTGPGGGVQFFDELDTATLTVAGAQSKALTYLPLPYSEHVLLNGVRQTRGAAADFTITGQVLNVLAGMDARVGDTLAIEYAYSGGVPRSPTIPATLGGAATLGATYFSVVQTPSSSGAQPVLPAGSAAGDLILFLVFAPSADAITLNGYTNRGNTTITAGGSTYRLSLLTKTLVAAEVPTLTASGESAWTGDRVVGGGSVNDVQFATAVGSSTFTGPQPVAGARFIRGVGLLNPGAAPDVYVPGTTTTRAYTTGGFSGLVETTDITVTSPTFTSDSVDHALVAVGVSGL